MTTLVAAQTDPNIAPGDRVYCIPANLTGEMVGLQGQWIGVRYDLGYIQWEALTDLRRAHSGETTGATALPPDDPLYPQQQGRMIRSQHHFGFDNVVLRIAIERLPVQFRTKDVSLQRDVLNAHPFAGTLRNYHAMVGRHLKQNQMVLGIRADSDAAHTRGALWTFTALAATGQSVDPPPNPGVPGNGPVDLERARKIAEEHIDDFLRSVGIANPAEVTNPDGARGVMLGSVRGDIGILQVDDELYLRVFASVMDLPSDGDLILPLMRDLLELNVNVLGPARASILGNAVVITASMPLAGMDGSWVGFTINNVMGMADHFDEPLLERYGGTSKQRS